MKVRLLLISCIILTTIILTPRSYGAEETKKVNLTVSPETTYFTEPRLPNGRIDYIAAINRICSEGITKENNILTGLFFLIPGETETALVVHSLETGEKLSIEKPLRDKIWKLLGYDAPPDIDRLRLLRPSGGTNPLEYLRKYYSQQAIDANVAQFKQKERQRYQSILDSDDSTPKVKEHFAEQLKKLDTATPEWIYREIIEHECDQTRRQLWTAKEFPLMDDWMKSTDAVAKELLEISKRPRYYHPSVGDDTECAECPYFSLLPYVQGTRDTARYFSSRGRWLYAQGKIDEAFECVFASLRLGIVLQKDADYLVTYLVGVSLEGIAQNDLALYLHLLQNSERKSEKNADWILAQKKKYDALIVSKKTSGIPKWMISERCGMLSIVPWYLSEPAKVRKTLLEVSDLDEEAKTRAKLLLEKCLDSSNDCDWNEVLKIINDYFDDCEDIVTQPDLRRQRRAMQRWKNRAQILDATLEVRAENIEKYNKIPFAKERLAADYFIHTLFPEIDRVYIAKLRNISVERMVDTVFALAACRAGQGTYPQSLDVLVPRFLDKIPDSPFTDQPIRYVKRDDKILLLNDDSYTLDGSETEIEKSITEVEKPVGFLHQTSKTVIIVLQE